MPNHDLRDVLRPIAERVQRQHEQIRKRSEWIDAAQRRLWERMDRLRDWQREEAAAEPR